MRELVLSLAFAVISAPAIGEPSQIATRNNELIERLPSSKDVFVVENDGAIRHLQSGMLCPADLQNVHFATPIIYPTSTTGSDVGCDYARAAPDGSIVSKLTIFAVKATEGATVDSVFASYKHEIVSAYPDAAEMPAALQIGDSATNHTSTDYRAVGYSITLDQRPAHSDESDLSE